MNNLPNPSLFIRLPKFPGGKWIEQDIMEVIDNLDYGVIEDVTVYANCKGDQYAIVHFDRWLRGAEDIANDLLRGAKFNITGLYGKSFNVSMYSTPQPRSYVRDPRMNRYKQEQMRVHTKSQVSNNNPRQEPLQVMITVYVQTIAGKLPIAPGLTFGHNVKPLLQSIYCNNEFVEDGEVAEKHYGMPLSRR